MFILKPIAALKVQSINVRNKQIDDFQLAMIIFLY